MRGEEAQDVMGLGGEEVREKLWWEKRRMCA